MIIKKLLIEYWFKIHRSTVEYQSIITTTNPINLLANSKIISLKKFHMLGEVVLVSANQSTFFMHWKLIIYCSTQPWIFERMITLITLVIKTTSVPVIITPTALSLKDIWCWFTHIYVYSESSYNRTRYSMDWVT